MKAVKLFISGIIEACKSLFGKPTPHKETEEDSIDMDVFTMTESQYEAKRQENLLELRTDYNVNVFTQWLFLGLFMFVEILGFALLFSKSLICIPIFAMSFIIYKLYEDRKVSAETKHSFISFLFLSQDDLDRINKTI
jgi:hypothetical protein